LREKQTADLSATLRTKEEALQAAQEALETALDFYFDKQRTRFPFHRTRGVGTPASSFRPAFAASGNGNDISWWVSKKGISLRIENHIVVAIADVLEFSGPTNVTQRHRTNPPHRRRN
jgi:hypothetical protein